MRAKMLRTVAVLCALLLMLGALCLLCGCRDSRSIKEITYTQDAENVDHENPNKYKIADPRGTAENNVNSSDYSVEKDAANSEEKLLNVVYTSKDPQTDLPAPPYVYDAQGKYNTEASEGVSSKPTSSSPKSAKSDDEENEKSDNSKSSGNKTAKGKKGKGTKSGSGKKGKKKSKKQKSKPSKKTNPEKRDTPKDDTSKKEQKPEVYDTTGDDPEIPDVESVAACGQIAVIAQMLGGSDGQTRLKASDAQLLDGEFSAVFADEGAADIVQAWKSDGSDNGDLSFDKLEKAKPDTVLVTSSGYFTSEQNKKLAAAKISVTVVPELRSATSIKAAVSTVGAMFSKATEGESQTRADEYVSYHDDLLERVEGEDGYAIYDNVIFDPDATKRPDTFKSNMWTLLIDEWDEGASFSGSGDMRGSISTAASGLGLASAGYYHSPASHYLAAAGVINNGAYVESGKANAGKLLPVWQFNTSLYDMGDISWSSAYADRVVQIGGGNFAKTTLVAGNSKNSVGDNGFGSDAFPYAILASQKMKDKFIAGSADDGPYRIISGDEVPDYNGNPIYPGIVSSVDLDDALVVNPRGLFTNWLEGSVESCLEAPWAASLPKFDRNCSVSPQDEIVRFYQTFYRYDLSSSEVESILKGADK